MRPPLPETDEDRLLIRHILDIAKRRDSSGRTLYSAFLDERQLAICETALSSKKFEFSSDGGYPDAERRVLRLEGQFDAELPFRAAVFNYPKDIELSHRDFLGALMALGIKREMLGDILVPKNNGRATVFVIKTALPLVEEMTKVGRAGVKVSFDFNMDDIPEKSFSEIHSTLASLRLDALVATALRLSRDRAAELIQKKGVMLNRVMCFSPAENVGEGDVFSVRGYGKFELYKVGGLTKKDRIVITVRIYN